VGNVYRRLIAFDLDGTLIDSRQDLADAANALIVELGGTPLSTDAVASMVGEGAAVLVARALSAAGVDNPSTSVARFLALYDERLLAHTQLYPGMPEVLSAARSCATVAVLTNKPLGPTERILSGLGVRDLVDLVVGGDGPHGRKPDPAGLQSLMRAADVDPGSTLMVGDSPVDRQTATRAGAFCCAVSYGFADHAAQLIAVLQDFVARSSHAEG
jgi:phosphoglycolate phosphatase